MKVLYSAVYDGAYPFDSLAETTKAVVDPDEMTELDSALIVWGGSDISPDLYQHPISRRCAPYAGRRDMVEWALMHEAISMGIPILGICRGAQMLCAAAGGFLIQDVQNHAGPDHYVITFDGKKLKTNSLHHQMMVPAKQTQHSSEVEYELVGWAEKNKGTPYIYKDDKFFDPLAHGFGDWKEPEFLYFPKIDGYAVQWHPEMMDENEEATKYIIDYFNTKQAALRPKKWWFNAMKKHEYNKEQR